MDESRTISSPSLADLPADELAAYAGELGLVVDARASRGEVLRLVRGRQALLVGLDRDALLEVIVWGRVPVRRSASKEVLAKQVASITKTQFDGLSDRGLWALARLRGLEARSREPRSVIERRLRRQEGLWGRLRRHRRSIVGSLVANVVESAAAEGDYQFLPEDDENPTLKESIEQAGVVGGIAQKLRGAADRYVYEKLDEIEHRIDRKLDEIDQRLAEWRDQEVATRLRLIKMTLIATIVVAIFSLGYNYLKSRSDVVRTAPEPTLPTAAADSV